VATSALQKLQIAKHPFATPTTTTLPTNYPMYVYAKKSQSRIIYPAIQFICPVTTDRATTKYIGVRFWFLPLWKSSPI